MTMPHLSFSLASCIDVNTGGVVVALYRDTSIAEIYHLVQAVVGLCQDHYCLCVPDLNKNLIAGVAFRVASGGSGISRSSVTGLSSASFSSVFNGDNY